MTADTAPERDIELVLVTGAGASYEFGVNGTKVPLMGAWSDALVDKLSRRSWSYLEAAGLQKGLDGEEFERRLGRFLDQVQVFPKIESLLQPSLDFQGMQSRLDERTLREWHQQTDHHLTQITNLIHESLYEQFSSERVDLDAAAAAYGFLLRQLRISGTDSWVYATTNYDILGEYAIERLGLLPDWGEQRRIVNYGDSPLRVDRLLGGLPRYVPVFHLHGRIGWYRRREGDLYSGNITRHDEGFGVPIVMLPDPDKTYDTEPVIFSLWEQFEEALRRARRVFVFGHSLNDRSLVGALRTNVAPPERVAVGLLALENDPEKPDPSSSPSILEILRTQLPAATTIPIRFAPATTISANGLRVWIERLTRAIDTAVA